MMRPRLDVLENYASDSQDQLRRCKNDIMKLQDRLLEMETDKLDVKEFDQFQKTLRLRLDGIEAYNDRLDVTMNEQKNWMDVFMPLRIQHQIFENLKEVLPRRYQHTLGLTDK